MEIFLLIILILLTVYFYSSLVTKFNDVDEKLEKIYKQVKKNEDKALREKIENINAATAKEPKKEPGAEKKKEDFPKAPPVAAFEAAKLTVVTEIIPPPPEAPVVKEEVPASPQTSEPRPEPVAAFSATSKQPVIEAITTPISNPVPPKKESLRTPLPPEEDWYTRFRKNNPDIEKFIGENLISKIGIAILVIGIALFVKYAIDKDWIGEVARVGIGILCGGIVLGFAHRLRLKFKAFSSVLVAGGISIFYFTIGIAFHQYQLFNQATAFAIMLGITCFSVFISVAYDRVELAALSLIGGFATPLIVSTGSGNYQVLFTYILILDTGMLVLAYLRKWNLINIMAYGFTMLLYFIWLQSKVIYKPEAPYAGALLFGAIFYVMFILMNIVNNIKERREFKALELTLLLSNTVLFYIAGMQILYYFHPEMRGLFNVGMALVNMVCAFTLYKKYKADPKLVYLLIGLTLTFITVATPIQLNGHYITMVWALEGVLLLWLGQRSEIKLYRFASVAVTIIMLFSLLITWTGVYGSYEDFNLPVIFNKGFITGVVAALSLLGISLLLRKETEIITYQGLNFHPVNYGVFAKALFVAILYISGLFELYYQLQTTGNSTAANYIVMEVYHLLFLVALNIGFANNNNVRLKKGLYTVNYISCIAFVLVFVFLPLSDFRQNLMRYNSNNIGFIFHYLSIVAALFLVKKMYRSPHKFTFESQESTNTVLLAASTVYLLSVELVLHISKFLVDKLSINSSNNELWTKLNELKTVQMHIVKIGFPILWGLLAFALLFLGMKSQNKRLRVISLVLIGITLVKLFIFDINHSSESGKIISFVILGLVLLIISFMYQKIKALLRSDDKNEDTPTPPQQPTTHEK
ncbi:MAG: DUF2339 domain-containing protein [Bacteroidia bacterium]|nr:DUF2339 domain-containing protein [Bacteroidia bacterium]